MISNKLQKIDSTNDKMTFDGIKHSDNGSKEYWSARELQKLLGYSSWQKFGLLINKAKISFKKSMVAKIHTGEPI